MSFVDHSCHKIQRTRSIVLSDVLYFCLEFSPIMLLWFMMDSSFKIKHFAYLNKVK